MLGVNLLAERKYEPGLSGLQSQDCKGEIVSPIPVTPILPSKKSYRCCESASRVGEKQQIVIYNYKNYNTIQVFTMLINI
uniref:Uncharacterized protein n=1 Tax=Romanomermis culicivorax TaxID=13658 RepID=A0A915JJK7_ROMCU